MARVRVRVGSPERHFHTFRGYLPERRRCSAAAVAIVTEPGYVSGGKRKVLPLHNPIGVAEECLRSSSDKLLVEELTWPLPEAGIQTILRLWTDRYADRRETNEALSGSMTKRLATLLAAATRSRCSMATGRREGKEST